MSIISKIQDSIRNAEIDGGKPTELRLGWMELKELRKRIEENVFAPIMTTKQIDKIFGLTIIDTGRYNDFQVL